MHKRAFAATLAALMISSGILSACNTASDPTSKPQESVTTAETQETTTAEQTTSSEPNETSAEETTKQTTIDPQFGDIDSTGRTQYNVNLRIGTIDKAGDLLEIEGEEEITFQNYSEDSWKTICLRDYNPSNLREEFGSRMEEYHTAITEISQGGKVLKFKEAEDPSIVTASLDKAVKPGKQGTIKVKFTLKVPEGSARQSYSLVDGKNIDDLAICLGPFLPAIPVYENGGWAKGEYFAFGECFYTKCADYKVHVEVPADYEVCATGADFKNGDGSYDFIASNMRDFSLLAGRNLNYLEGAANGVAVKVWYYDTQDYAKEAAEDTMLPLSVNAVKVMSDYFGDYPYDDLDVVMCSFAYGGMESPGFIRINDDYIKPSEGEDEEAGHNLHHLTESLVHEIGHEWFYSAVGNDQYNEAWLDEGFATFAEYLYRVQTGDDDEITQNQGKIWCDTWHALCGGIKIDLSYDDYVNDKTAGLQTPAEYKYTYCVYSGGASFLYDLRELMGEDDFRELMRDWYKSNSGKEVSTKLFLQAVSDRIGSDNAKDLFSTYFSAVNYLVH
ncbi:MAG: hypothetical protein J5778_07445 [Clostridiales bacterium]|nr:hypothetical protein [Clostridiales bacterium]